MTASPTSTPWAQRRWFRPLAVALVVLGLLGVPVALWAGAFLDATSNQVDVMMLFFAVGPIGVFAAIWSSSAVALGGFMLTASAPTRRSPWAVIGFGVIGLAAAWTLAWGVRVAQVFL